MRALYLTPGCFDKGGVSRYCRYQIRALRELLGPDQVEVLSVLAPDEESIEEPFEVSFAAGGIEPRHKLAFVLHAGRAALARSPAAVFAAHVNLAGLAHLLAVSARVTAPLRGAQTVVNIYGFEAWSRLRPDASLGLRSTEHLISDCHFTARYLEEKGVRPRGSTDVVWDCVDVERFSPRAPRPEVLARYGIPDPTTGINVVTLGRIMKVAAYKGYERLLTALHALAGGPATEPCIRVIFAGRGDLVPFLRERAAELGIADRVFFTGAVHEDDLPDVYRSAHVFSLVADRGVDRGEGLPLTPLEASACGVPILVGDQDGSQEAVIDAVTGYLVPSLDTGVLASRIATLASQPDLRAKMGQAARQRAVEVFGYARFVEEHRRLLDRWQIRRG